MTTNVTKSSGAADSICPVCGLDLQSHNTKQVIQCAIDELTKKKLLGQHQVEYPNETSWSEEVTVE